MFGQTNVIRAINNQIKQNVFPRFSIFEGAKGSGRKTLIKELFPGAVFMEDCKIDTVRKMIQMMNKQRDSVFIITDADDMSTAAKQAILKVAEEPPNNNKLILTVEDRYSMPDTINSRAGHFMMDRYTPKTLYMYYWSLEGSELMPHGMPNDAEIIQDVCETPGEIRLMIENGVQELDAYVALVIANIAKVSGANAFKIASRVALKDTDEGFDLKLFWKMFIRKCAGKDIGIHEKTSAINITTRSLADLRIKGINRQFLIDKWILDIRSAWCGDDV